MSRFDDLDHLLGEIAQRCGLPLKLDAQGRCFIEYGGVFEIALTSIDDGLGVMFDLPITMLSPASADAQLRRCMELNLHGIETDGGTLGFDSVTQWVILSQRWTLHGVSSQILEQRLVELAQVVDDLREKLVPSAIKAPQTTSEVPPPNEDTVVVQA